jgi:anaerobic magnesium-protoporphyrin IX monomethyl ester cyclase
VSDVQLKTRMLQKRGIQAGMFIMLGYEGEDIPQLEETVDHLKKSNPDVFLTTVAYPIKGTAYYTEVESRVLSAKAWDDRSDRDLTVAGRHSKRFYSFATRWLVNEVALHRARQSPQKDLVHLAKAFVNAKVGKLGMTLTAGEVEK